MNTQYECYYAGCNHAYPSKYNLVRHINNTHLGIKKYFCQQCSKRFPNKQGLTIHEKSHLRRPTLALAPNPKGKTEFLLTDHYREQLTMPPLKLSCTTLPALPLIDHDRQTSQSQQSLPLLPSLLPD